ncbi:hypothetical protein GTO89_02390 [Heliobacterium gestii]|uniref:Basal-body rod modification protein FlgD n=1 Tax=Heliomicrobium gestii TaxID=2699 RepID=A0A845L8G9_HELGE|nr:flagellar hook capping FlgD N-terminal domain-containing protein [Heliomicrobium gestii]MBM7865631.1 flagellar basal-body rod modification protein FlgD [Heliomicrobium gestii]MZP41881.1 hypothetical protein [Heliomicrobium gestii]
MTSVNTIDATTTQTTAQTTSSTSTTAATQSTGASLGKDDFLKLLITQMRYQDPLSPMDNSDMIAQMAQFSSLEQTQNVATNVKELTSTVEKAITSMTQFGGASLIGKEVTATLDALDSSGNAITDANGQTSTVEVSGAVSGYKVVDGKTVLVVNGQNVALERVTEVSQTEVSQTENSLGEV